MNNNDVLRISNLNYAFGAIVFAVTFWGIFGLKVHNILGFLLFKFSFLLLFWGQAYLIRNRKMSTNWSLDISCNAIYVYAFIGTMFFHSTYIFAFYEGLALSCFFYTGPILRYTFQAILGITLTIISFNFMPEPEFVKAGYSIDQHLRVMTIVFGALSIAIYWFFNRQRELIYLKDQKFASIGRQSAFLLHELKSPLCRFIMSGNQNENRDAEHILSIVEGVELLITNRENIRFDTFSWKEVGDYLREEFFEMSDHYKVPIALSGFEEDTGWGHKSTIKLALRNLVKNAFEAIQRHGQAGEIRVQRTGNEVLIQNNGPAITKEKMRQLFKPFESEKNSTQNFGIGLHFVENVIKVHNGSISVDTDGEWTNFRMKISEFK